MQRIKDLAALILSRPTPPPPIPAFPGGIGVGEVQTVPAPMPASRVQPARTQPAAASIPTPRWEHLVPPEAHATCQLEVEEETDEWWSCMPAAC